MDITKSYLYQKIINERNIYNAIYSMESYVYEKGLLSKDDLELFNQLSDKFNRKLIDEVIAKCKKRLMGIICKRQLFNATIYFKLKKYNVNKDEISFRPIHTASLLDQICMVCMLNLIMFDYNKVDGRVKSDISKLLPYNFFGNIPSTKYEQLFWPWKLKYKEYSETTINKYREYKRNKRYSTMVSLDLKDFYPSIHPGYIFNYIYNYLKVIYKNEEDLECLRIVISKLLFFKIKQDNLEGWHDVYFPNNDVEGGQPFYFCRGIPQGLPQSFFFGNLFMIKVSEIVTKYIPGDSYYYVDDSVIFTNNLTEKFNDVIKKMNSEMIKCGASGNEYLHYLPREYNKVMGNVNYKVQFHEEGKSIKFSLDSSHDYAGGFMMIAAQVSKAAVFYDNLEEIDDNMSLKKLDSLVSAIDNELQYLKDHNVSSNDVKMLLRYRRFFLFRKRLLELRNAEESTFDIRTRFYTLFQIREHQIDLKKLFETFDEEIFHGECRLMLQSMNIKEGREFYDGIVDYERRLCSYNHEGRNFRYLYYSHDLNNTVLLKNFSSRRYDSLTLYLRNTYSSYSQAPFTKKLEMLKFLMESPRKFLQYKHARNVSRHSNEYMRQKLNALFSYIFNVDITDRPSFYKHNSRAMNYVELRSLAYLRNSFFSKERFSLFIQNLYEESKTPVGLAAIDSRIFEVLAIFLKQVREPHRVDDLIVTHRLVNGLWKNGSKFLNFYTLHNEEHAIALIRQSMHLLKVFDDLGLKRNDYYVLFLACYLHDISMVVHPDMTKFNASSIKTDEVVTRCLSYAVDTLGDKPYLLAEYKQVLLYIFNAVFGFFEEDTRSKHPYSSAEFVKMHHNDYFAYVDDSVLQIVADVSEAHGYDADDVYGLRSWAKCDLYSVKYLMILLRLADLMDMSKDRVSYYLLRENIRSMGAVSKFHWISHLITDKAEVSADYKVDTNKRIYARPIQEEIEVHIYLNTQYNVRFIKDKACNRCSAFSKGEQKVIQITDTPCPNYGKCSFMCVWMHVKNEYLFSELYALQDYLDKLDSSIFLPTIKVVIHTENRTSLDEDFFDEVRSYLQVKAGTME